MSQFIRSFKNLALLFSLFIVTNTLKATGEPSTWFNVFIPPNNDNVQRNVCLVVTAISDSTLFNIIDDGMDGDTDDSVSGMLMAGQSYILYIKDNGINDDAKYASGGTLKQDGDYFTITSNKLVYASQSTDSDWQHDWVPSVNKSSMGQKFIVYAPKISSSNRDLNTLVYEANTQITIRKISKSSTIMTGYTNVDIYNSTIVAQKILNPGQDIIYFSGEGRNVMTSGDTYLVESNKPITLQYGALYGNERDGGGYVPSSNGSSAGELFHFAVPFQSGTTGEQEIRISSWSANNVVTLERYSAGTWIAMKTWTINANKAVDWVGKNEGNVNYSTVFRVKCSAGKKVSVFEANWLETGSIGTSDIGTMASSDNGTSSGQNFLVYMAPPGNEQNVKNPFTGLLFAQQLTHCYIFSFNDTCFVTVKDAYTNGTDLTKTFTVMPGRYVDCYLTVSEWKSIYNGTGTTSGPERPYVFINSNKPISVMNTNFNDNWMMYFGSSLEQSFGQTSNSSKESAMPGDTVVVSSNVVFKTPTNIDSAYVSVRVSSGAEVVSSTLKDVTVNETTSGTITKQTNQTVVSFPVKDSLTPTHNYVVETTVVPQVMYNNGNLLPNNSVVSVQTDISGRVSGILQESSSSEGIQVQSSNTSNMMFTLETFNGDLTNSWTANIVDIDNDSWEDIYLTDKDETKSNIYYKNNGNNTFTKTTINNLTTDKTSVVCSSWGDMDNDGDKDVLVVTNTKKPNFLYLNNGAGAFNNMANCKVNDHPAYFHSGSFADYDNDGYLDIFLSNFMPTRFNELYHNNGNGTFSQVSNNVICGESFMSLGATWADYDNDGDQDLFVPNGNGENNSLFRNDGNGSFTKQTSLNVCNDGGNSVASCWGDINNDGWLDLFVSNASNQNNFLYVNNKNGTFTKVTTGPCVNDGGHSHGCSFVDVDNDMDLDLYVTNDKGVKFLYLNDGMGNFVAKRNEIVNANFGNSMGNYWFDADKDGDLDLFVPTHSGQVNYFFSNNCNGAANYISVRLTGSLSNRDAIGARINIKSGGVWQCREVNSQSGLGGQSSVRCHFGLANNSVIDSIMVKWPSGQVQYLTNVSSNAFINITEPSGGIVKGCAFFDKNNNCLKDAGEDAISGLRIDINTNYHAITKNDGSYQASLATGIYSLNIQQGIWSTNCAATVSVQNNTTYTVNIPLTTSVQGVNLKTNISATAMRKGFKNQMVFNVQNNGSDVALNVPVNLSTNGNVKVKTCTPAYNSNTNNVYSWVIDTLKAGETKTFRLLDSVYLSAPIGTDLNFTLNALYNEDLNQEDNQSIYTSKVVGAIDPNDLLVFPGEETDSSYIKKETVLIYKVRFQNVGNYMASNILVEDKLPAELDYSAIKFLQSSHPCEFSYDAAGKVTIRFTEINLPDSTTSESDSHGFVEFSVPLKNSVEDGTRIINKADIYFDYEEALSTNKVVSKLVTDISKDNLLVYPNPSNGIVQLQLKSTFEQHQSGKNITEATILNTEGRILLNLKAVAEVLNINLNNLSPGLYIVQAKDNFGFVYYTRLIISR